MKIRAYQSGLGREYSPDDWRQFFWQEKYLEANSFDFHLHSTASDGSLTPSDLADQLVALGLNQVILTDHDTASGQAEFINRLQALGHKQLDLSGIELSVNLADPGQVDQDQEVHLLAYFDQASLARFQPYLDQDLIQRYQRNLKIIARLQDLGYQVSLTDLYPGLEPDLEVNPLKLPIRGRVHLAEIIHERDQTASVNQIFQDLFLAGCPAYIAREKRSIIEAIKAVKEAGGLCSLAHPHEYGWFNGPQLGQLSLKAWQNISYLAGRGLDGLEVWHGQATESVRRQASLIALANRLFRTGGSDYHGGRRNRRPFRPGSLNLRPELLVVAACIYRNGQIFMGQRNSGDFMAGYWEFPGGKVEAGECPRAGLIRELEEELGLQVADQDLADQPFYAKICDYPDYRVNLLFYKLKLNAAIRPRLKVHAKGGFFNPDQLSQLKVLPANYDLIQYLQETGLN